MSFLGALTGFILVLAPTAPPVVTVEALAADPAKYDGKTLVVRADVSGTAAEGPKWVRLAVRGESGVVVAADLSRDKVTFVVPKDQKDVVGGGVENEFRPMRLTVEVKRGERLGVWLAVVTRARAVDGPTSKGDTTPTPAGAKPTGDETSKGAGNRPKGTRASPVEGDAQSALSVVVAEGAGVTPHGALADALRNAVRQVVGAVVDAETLVKNDDIVSDKVLTLSGGLVKKYDEVGRRQNNGLHFVTIRATVERAQVIAKLKASNVAVKEVDGKGLFAEVVTGLEQTKNAKALLGKKLQEYRADVVRAEPVGKPRVKRAGDIETTIEYDVRVSVDNERYDDHVKTLLPILKHAARRHGEFHTEWKETGQIQHDNNTSHGQFLREEMLQDDRRWPFASVRVMERVNDRSGVWPWRTGKSAGQDLDGHIPVMVNVKRSKSDDRLTWAWYIVPDPGLTASGVVLEVTVNGGEEITSNRLVLGPDVTPGCHSGVFKGLHDDRVILLSPRISWCAGTFFARTCDIRFASMVPSEDLRKIKSVRCTVRTAEPSGSEDKEK